MNTQLWRRLQPPALLLVAVAVATVATWGRAFWLDTSIMMAIFSLFALSAGMSFGMAGIPSIATGAFAAIGAYCSAGLTMRTGVSPFFGLLLAVSVPAVLAFGLAKAVTRLSPLPLSLATFALSGAVEVAIRGGGDLTGGYVGLSGIPPIEIAQTPQAMHFLAWAAVLLAVFCYSNLLHSSLGRAIKAARHDSLRAVADGVNVSQLLAMVFSFSASIAGLGGWLYAHYISYISPESLNTTTAISALLMAVVGGTRAVLGPVVGAVLLTLLNIVLPAAQSQGMVYGAALVAILVLAPQGLINLVRWRSKPSRTPRAEGHEGARAAARPIL
jgi:branched-chain amino acid transport system permease protein